MSFEQIKNQKKKEKKKQTKQKALQRNPNRMLMIVVYYHFDWWFRSLSSQIRNCDFFNTHIFKEQ